MKPKNLMKCLKISLVFIVILIAIFLVSILLQFPISRANIFSYLGIFPAENDSCSGTLSLSRSGSSKCTIEAKVVSNGCRGKTYQVRENSCSGNIMCQDSIDYDSFQTTCSWSANSGNYNYVLCINGFKDSGTVVCS
jgi:hypothetical protein